MVQTVKTKKRWTFLKSPKKFFKAFLGPDEEEEIPDELGNEDYNKFRENLKNIQEKTGTTKKEETIRAERYKIVKRSKEIDDKNIKIKQERDRDED